MPDDLATPLATAGPRPPVARASSSGLSGPPGHTIRRALTIDDSALRRRPTMNHLPSDASEAPPRRSSNFSDYSFTEARHILNPQVKGVDEMPSPESSSLASLSLAFALLPAVAGVLFKNGSAVVTDVMLLGLAGVFLHWSVTQPWTWYHSAQETRIQREGNDEAVFEDESDLESPPPAADDSRHNLDDVPEEEDETSQAPTKTQTRDDRQTAQQQAALRELYVYEVVALMSCFALPLISAFLLHAIRSQLSRPSEGLVSNYNLTIFLLVSELRVFSHMIKLLQSRTLHLQRIVHSAPFPRPRTNGPQMDELTARIERLEARSTAEEALLEKSAASSSERSKQEAAMTRDVRNAIQPELDALNRAVRRYEKKATMLQLQTESRFAGHEARLDDAIALAAAAAKTSASQKNILLWTVESIFALLLLPFNAILQLLLLPLTTAISFISGKKQKSGSAKTSKAGRSGKAPAQVKYSGDRVPARVAKR